MKDFNSIFRDFERRIVGYDKFFEHVESQARTAWSSFPPYSIRKDGDNKYVIELALAGFGKQDVEVTLDEQTLRIKGALKDKGGDYIFSGIANRAFNREFVVKDNVMVKGATMANGILKIMLEHMIPEKAEPKKINISDEAETVS